MKFRVNGELSTNYWGPDYKFKLAFSTIIEAKNASDSLIVVVNDVEDIMPLNWKLESVSIGRVE